MIRIYNAKDLIEANRIVSLLKEEGIPSYVSGSGTGEYMEIAMGHSVYGMDISVREEDEVRAKKVILQLLETDHSVGDEKEADVNLAGTNGAGPEEEINGNINAGSDKHVNANINGESDEDTGNEPWYRNQKITARAVVLVFAIILILLGVFEMLMN